MLYLMFDGDEMDLCGRQEPRPDQGFGLTEYSLEKNDWLNYLSTADNIWFQESFKFFYFLPQ